MKGIIETRPVVEFEMEAVNFFKLLDILKEAEETCDYDLRYEGIIDDEDMYSDIDMLKITISGECNCLEREAESDSFKTDRIDFSDFFKLADFIEAKLGL